MRPRHLNFHNPHSEKRKRFFHDFIRQVSPLADPTSVVLFGQIMRTNNLLEQAAERNLGASELSWAKFRLLMNLKRGERSDAAEGMQPSQLSDEQGVSRNTVSSLIAGLEKDGLISRELHGTDRRRFIIRLTPAGRKILRMNIDHEFQFVSHCFDVISHEERQTLLDILTRLNESLVEKNK